MLNLEAGEYLVVDNAVTGIQAAYSGSFSSAGLGEAAESEYITYPLRVFKDMSDI